MASWHYEVANNGTDGKCIELLEIYEGLPDVPDGASVVVDTAYTVDEIIADLKWRLAACEAYKVKGSRS